MEVLNLRSWAAGPLLLENAVACNHYEEVSTSTKPREIDRTQHPHIT
jgi:hypothetical protein